MKEDKKKTAPKNNTTKKNNSSNKNHNNKVNNNKKNDNNVNKKRYDEDAPRVTKIESPVKEVRAVKVDDDFIEEDNDKKLIVVIAIAILVILATIIGLLVGCEKQEENPEPPKKDDEIVVPVQVDDDEDDEDEVVVKVSTNKSQEDEDDEVETVIATYDVMYYYGNGKTHHESVKEGSTASKYVPTGYNSCSYFVDENFSEDYDFAKVNKDTNIYMNCDLMEYTVVYEEGLVHNNKTVFTVEDDFELTAPEVENIFIGWYLDNEFTNSVTSLNASLVKYADNANTIYLYAKTEDNLTIALYNEKSELVSEQNVTKEDVEGYTLPDAANLNVCVNSNFLGWTETEGSKYVDYKNKSSLELNKDYTLYAVCGDATIVYTSNGETVSVGYTNEELKEEGFDLPAPSDLGMGTPTYFVPVDEETLTSKKVVSDDEVELGENEVYFSEVANNAINDYVPTIGDNVEVFEKEFVGWIEKTEETTTPEEETTPSEGETTPEEGTTPETGIEGTEGEVVEEVPVLSPEEVKDLVENDTDEPAEVELEAVWEVQEQHKEVEVAPEVDTEVAPEEPTPEVGTEGELTVA